MRIALRGAQTQGLGGAEETARDADDAGSNLFGHARGREEAEAEEGRKELRGDGRRRNHPFLVGRDEFVIIFYAIN